MSQRKYLTNLVEQFGKYPLIKKRLPMRVDYEGYGSSCNPKLDKFYKTPVDDTRALTGEMKTMYESGVGSLSWAANNTRPDLSFAVNQLSSRTAHATQADFE